MRLHRFYIAPAVGNKTELTIDSADLVNQIRRVFRLKTGDTVIVFDGSGSDYECTIVDFGKESLSLNVVSSQRSHFMPTRDVYLYAAIVKKDTFEWIVEKATELGVTHIIPVMAERSEKKSLNEMRLRKIAIEASEQSGRGSIPVIHPIIQFAESMDIKKGLESISFDIEAPVLDVSHLSKNVSYALFIGPEGGWSADEIAMFHNHGIPVKSLGTQVLRAETAVVAALSVVMLGN